MPFQVPPGFLGKQSSEYPAVSAPGIKIPDKPHGLQHPLNPRSSCPQRSDPFHALGWIFCPFPSQQTPPALVLLQWQCQSSSGMEQAILAPAGFSGAFLPEHPHPSCSFLQLQGGQKVSVGAQNPFPILPPPPSGTASPGSAAKQQLQGTFFH